MSAPLGIKLQAEPLRTLSYLEIDTDFTMIGDPYANPIRIYHLQNLTDVTLSYSWDGVNDHGILASGGFILLDCTANKSLDQGLYLPVGGATYLTTAGIAPSEGGVYLSVFYSAVQS